MGKVAGYPMRKIKRVTLIFEGRNPPRYGAILSMCNHVAVRPKSELDRAESIQCYACPRQEQEPKPTPPPADNRPAPSVDLSPLVAELQRIRREIKDELTAMDQRLTQVEDVKTTPSAASGEDKE